MVENNNSVNFCRWCTEYFPKREKKISMKYIKIAKKLGTSKDIAERLAFKGNCKHGHKLHAGCLWRIIKHGNVKNVRTNTTKYKLRIPCYECNDGSIFYEIVEKRLI